MKHGKRNLAILSGSLVTAGGLTAMQIFLRKGILFNGQNLNISKGFAVGALYFVLALVFLKICEFVYEWNRKVDATFESIFLGTSPKKGKNKDKVCNNCSKDNKDKITTEILDVVLIELNAKEIHRQAGLTNVDNILKDEYMKHENWELKLHEFPAECKVKYRFAILFYGYNDSPGFPVIYINANSAPIYNTYDSTYDSSKNPNYTILRKHEKNFLAQDLKNFIDVTDKFFDNKLLISQSDSLNSESLSERIMLNLSSINPFAKKNGLDEIKA